MFDARYVAFVTIAGLLVASPGATMAVVTEMALEEGRAAALFTVVGVNIGNSSLALASAFGMSAVFARWPSALEVVKVAGAIYLAYLGLRGLWLAWRPRGGSLLAPVAADGAASAGRERAPRRAALVRGIMTNLLNPPVILFYMTMLPQFIGPRDPFLERFLVLAATHVGMSLAWLTFYALALGVVSERMARPGVRRSLGAVTGAVLVGFGIRLFLR